jgi:hypothetical protein
MRRRTVAGSGRLCSPERAKQEGQAGTRLSFPDHGHASRMPARPARTSGFCVIRLNVFATKVFPDPEEVGRSRKGKISLSFSKPTSPARIVLKYTAETAEQVLAGMASLNEAYELAAARISKGHSRWRLQGCFPTPRRSRGRDETSCASFNSHDRRSQFGDMYHPYCAAGRQSRICVGGLCDPRNDVGQRKRRAQVEDVLR